ncbi:MAG: 1-deoxy-D-xylulose-5-phosphate reductoisomerase, partial [Dehalococcoidales bacterium]
TKHRFLSLDEMACLDEVDIVVVATSGKAGLAPTLAAVRAGKKVALANKESLVMAGEIVMNEAKRSGASIRPVDSEHSAIWQCLNGESQPAKRLILTASGGPFRGYTPEKLEGVSLEQALNHPSWRMGSKVTIDSATLMNKGLEVIEAHWLFDMPLENIDVVIHPQSIVHSMVEYTDGSLKAQLSYPDMRLPIQYALSYPERLPNSDIPRIDWAEVSSLTFEQPDYNTFPCLKLALEAGRQGGTNPAVLCAADEVAVELFLNGDIGFTDIPLIIEKTLAEHKTIEHPGIEQILESDNWARNKVRQLSGGDN